MKEFVGLRAKEKNMQLFNSYLTTLKLKKAKVTENVIYICIYVYIYKYIYKYIYIQRERQRERKQ